MSDPIPIPITPSSSSSEFDRVSHHFLKRRAEAKKRELIREHPGRSYDVVPAKRRWRWYVVRYRPVSHVDHHPV